MARFGTKGAKAPINREAENYARGLGNATLSPGKAFIDGAGGPVALGQAIGQTAELFDAEVQAKKAEEEKMRQKLKELEIERMQANINKINQDIELAPQELELRRQQASNVAARAQLSRDRYQLSVDKFEAKQQEEASLGQLLQKSLDPANFAITIPESNAIAPKQEGVIPKQESMSSQSSLPEATQPSTAPPPKPAKTFEKQDISLLKPTKNDSLLETTPTVASLNAPIVSDAVAPSLNMGEQYAQAEVRTDPEAVDSIIEKANKSGNAEEIISARAEASQRYIDSLVNPIVIKSSGDSTENQKLAVDEDLDLLNRKAKVSQRQAKIAEARSLAQDRQAQALLDVSQRIPKGEKNFHLLSELAARIPDLPLEVRTHPLTQIAYINTLKKMGKEYLPMEYSEMVADGVSPKAAAVYYGGEESVLEAVQRGLVEETEILPVSMRKTIGMIDVQKKMDSLNRTYYVDVSSNEATGEGSTVSFYVQTEGGEFVKTSLPSQSYKSKQVANLVALAANESLGVSDKDYAKFSFNRQRDLLKMKMGQKYDEFQFEKDIGSKDFSKLRKIANEIVEIDWQNHLLETRSANKNTSRIPKARFFRDKMRLWNKAIDTGSIEEISGLERISEASGDRINASVAKESRALRSLKKTLFDY